MSRRSIEEVQKRMDSPWRATNDKVISAEAAGARLIQSHYLNDENGSCLTHRVRYVVEFAESPHIDKRTGLPWFPAHRGYKAECGPLFHEKNVVIVDPADELFICHKCAEACAKYGLDDFGLVPTRGCESSGGRLGMKRRSVEVGP